MKKLILPAVLFCALAITSCKSDDDGDGDNCGTLTQASVDAGTAYAADTSVANCNAYKSSLEALITNNCVEGTNATATQAIIDGLDCTE